MRAVILVGLVAVSAIVFFTVNLRLMKDVLPRSVMHQGGFEAPLSKIVSSSVASGIRNGDYSNVISSLFTKNETRSLPSVAKKSTTKIVAFCTANFIKVAEKWYNRMTKLGYTEHVIIASDDATAQYFSGRNYRVEVVLSRERVPMEFKDLKWAKKTRMILLYLFATRWRYILSQLQEGNNLLFTDVDNIFSRHVPLSSFSDSPYDIYHAYETKHPEHIYKRQGFVICGGMSWFRADPKVVEFVRVIVEKCGDYCDDQVILNEVLHFDMKMVWNDNVTDFKPMDGSYGDRFEGIPTVGRSGYSNVTGHRVKIWDRDFAFRGLVDPKPCPIDNWVSMPILSAKTRQDANRVKLNAFDEWDKNCPYQSATQ